MASVRILIVDDYEFWRFCVVSMLRDYPEFVIVGEGSDGYEAVEMSEDLKPDIVLLDLALPELNGFEAARQIREVSCHSRIVFLSQAVNDDLVNEARNTGAQAYVSKMDAAIALVPAMRSALAGKWYS